MSTINHKISVLNAEGTAYDVYHVETNTSQVYDFTRSKWLNAIITDLETSISNITGGIDVTELNDKLNSAITDLDSVESVISVIQTELAKKYVKPQNGIPLADLEASIRTSIEKTELIDDIQNELVSIRAYIDEEISKIKVIMKVHVERFTATSGQTQFVLTNEHSLDIDTIKVIVGGVEQYYPENYNRTTDENGVTTIEFYEGLAEGLIVVVEYHSDIDTNNEIIQSELFSIKRSAESTLSLVGDNSDAIASHVNNETNMKHVSVINNSSQTINIVGAMVFKITGSSDNVVPSEPINKRT